MEVYAVVHRRRKSRKGKGFSRGELKEVGLSLKQALKLRIQIDARRSSKHGENVKTLKTYLSKEVPTPETLVTLGIGKGGDLAWERKQESVEAGKRKRSKNKRTDKDTERKEGINHERAR